MPGTTLGHVRVLIRFDDGTALVFSTYETGQLVKNSVPRWGRRWDASRRCRVLQDPVALRACLVALRRECDRVEVIAVYPPPPAPSHAGGNGIDHLLRDLPARLRRPAARALVKVFHPDVGGDHEAMVALNDAMEALG